jgi:phosphomannomutase/phosphoglucomutase
MFRDYDVRGQVNDSELNERAIEVIGRAFGTLLKKRGLSECIVGYDARSYNEALCRGLVRGLCATGVSVVNIGMVTTPVAYFSQYHLKIKGLAMITASHNPNGWSGLKLGYDYSSTLLPAEVAELYDLTVSEKFASGKGKERSARTIDAYVKNLRSRTNVKKKFRIVVNARNGIAGIVSPKVFRDAGMDVVEQYCNIDFDYPHGPSNPSVDSMMDELGERVVAEKADLGLAFDADGDRLGVCDEFGEVIYPDRTLALLARRVLQDYPGAQIIFDVKCSQALIDDIVAHGGKPVMWKTGHSYIKEKLHELDAPLAGERSGHIFFRQGYYGFDDPCYAALKLLEYLVAAKQPLSAVVQTIPVYYTSSVFQAPCADELKKEVVKRLVGHFKKNFKDVVDIDGARVVFADGWGLVRSSSNTPALVLVFEAKTKKRLAEIEQLFRSELARFPEIGADWYNA